MVWATGWQRNVTKGLSLCHILLELQGLNPAHITQHGSNCFDHRNFVHNSINRRRALPRAHQALPGAARAVGIFARLLGVRGHRHRERPGDGARHIACHRGPAHQRVCACIRHRHAGACAQHGAFSPLPAARVLQHRLCARQPGHGVGAQLPGAVYLAHCPGLRLGRTARRGGDVHP